MLRIYQVKSIFQLWFRPGDGQMEIKTFMNNIMNEKPAFGVLKAA